MPKSITFFSRGKTPIYVNYVIAHNTTCDPYSGKMRCCTKASAIMQDPFLFIVCRKGI